VSDRRKTVRTILMVAAVAVLLIPPTIYFFVKSAEERAWSEMRRWCDQTAADLRSRPAERPVLRGTAVPGNAWDDYEEGLRSLPSQQALYPAGDYSQNLSDSAVDKVADLLQRHGSSIEALRRGAGRSYARRPMEWEHPPDRAFGRTQLYASLATCRARFLVEEGRPREAMDLLLDVAQYGEDAALNGSIMDGIVGVAILSIPQDELQRMLVAGSLGRDDCRELVRTLELLDRGFPREDLACAVDSMTSGFDYLHYGTIQAILARMEISNIPAPGWRYCFSDRLALVDAFRWERLWGQKMSAAAGGPWAAAREIWEHMAADRRVSPNPLLQKFSTLASVFDVPPVRSPYRERRAQLRLLRSAAAWLSSGEIAVLDDPYGDKIHVSSTGTHLKIWSVGADGVDDGGSGEWRSRSGKDIVLEVERAP